MSTAIESILTHAAALPRLARIETLLNDKLIDPYGYMIFQHHALKYARNCRPDWSEDRRKETVAKWWNILCGEQQCFWRAQMDGLCRTMTEPLQAVTFENFQNGKLYAGKHIKHFTFFPGRIAVPIIDDEAATSPTSPSTGPMAPLWQDDIAAGHLETIEIYRSLLKTDRRDPALKKRRREQRRSHRNSSSESSGGEDVEMDRSPSPLTDLSRRRRPAKNMGLPVAAPFQTSDPDTTMQDVQPARGTPIGGAQKKSPAKKLLFSSRSQTTFALDTPDADTKEQYPFYAYFRQLHTENGIPEKVKEAILDRIYARSEDVEDFKYTGELDDGRPIDYNPSSVAEDSVSARIDEIMKGGDDQIVDKLDALLAPVVQWNRAAFPHLKGKRRKNAHV